VSLMPKKNLSEHWMVDGKAPAEAWTLRDGVIACTGQPNGFLRSRMSYRNYVVRAEWRFQTGWEPTGKQEWPNAGFFIHAHEVENGWPKSLEVQGYFGEAGSLFGVRGGKIAGAKRGRSSQTVLPSAHGTNTRSRQSTAKSRLSSTAFS
jgi:hypothetical protein